MSEYSTIVAHVEDRPGVLARVASLFRRRGFNIESLTVGKADEPGLSRMTIVVEGGAANVQQVARQLFKLIDVVSVVDISDQPVIDREMSLIKVSCQPAQLVEVGELVKAFRADIVDVGPQSIIVQVLGDGAKVEALEGMLRPYGVLEMVRTGRVAMVRGQRTSKPPPVSVDAQEAEAARAQLGRRPEGALPFASD